jgi:hypothetical protein
MTSRAYYSASISEFLAHSAEEIIGQITQFHTQDLVMQQTQAWLRQIQILHANLQGIKTGHLFFEFQIPRMGRRADVVLVISKLHIHSRI